MDSIVLATKEINKSIFESIVDGEGLRLVLFTCGCKHYCKDCHNKDTWNINNGTKHDIDTVIEYLYEKLSKYPYDGLTFSGGDPILQEEAILKIIIELRNRLKELNIWLYTGYVYEDIKDMEIIKHINVLVDGPFIKEYKKADLQFRGSSNQNVLELHEGKIIKKLYYISNKKEK